MSLFHNKHKALTVVPNYMCPKESIINVDGENVCENCGVVHGYQAVTEFIDFYENKIIYNKI